MRKSVVIIRYLEVLFFVLIQVIKQHSHQGTLIKHY